MRKRKVNEQNLKQCKEIEKKRVPLESCSAWQVILSFLHNLWISKLSRCSHFCKQLCHISLVQQRIWNQNTIQKLTHTEDYNHVKQMKIHRKCNEWPPYITHIKIEDRKTLRDIPLPASVQYLRFDGYFQRLNTELLSLVHLTHIAFDGCWEDGGFNQSIHHLFPDSVTYLNLGPYFNQPIMNDRKSLLPAQLQTLLFGTNGIWGGSRFNQCIDVLPPELKELQLSAAFHQPVHSLPNQLQTIHMGHDFQYPLTCLPSSLQSLHLSNDFNNDLLLPPHLTELNYGHEYNKKITYRWPSSLTSIDFGWEFNQKLSQRFPPGLHTLRFGHAFNQRFQYRFPCSLTVLQLGWNFNKPISLPPLLKYLYFQHNFNQPLDPLPQTLEHLQFGDRFNQRLTLPDGLQHLRVGKDYRRKLHLPPNLKTFISRTKLPVDLPASLTYCKMGKHVIVSSRDLFAPLDLRNYIVPRT
jgi:hypothetical protein